MLDVEINSPAQKITYSDKIFLVGSCFTEHIGNSLDEMKFNVMQNPHGILFDPASVVNSLVSYVENKQYDENDLFQLNEVWNSWEHHSRFSALDAKDAVSSINQSQQAAHEFLKHADWIIVTLGSSFSYRLRKDLTPADVYGKANGPFLPVANCHRAPAGWFSKHLMEIEETITLLDTCYHRLKQFNPRLKILFTVSPVRHLRDGVVENNRSKARLIEAVHHITGKFDNLFYFPAYELVIDVLRDYRFFDKDFAHPNYMATTYVLEQFAEYCLDASARDLMKEIRKLVLARRHRPLQPETNAHRKFLQANHDAAVALKERYPFLQLNEEIDWFRSQIG